MPLAVISEFSSPPVSPERATDVSGASGGSVARAVEPALHHLCDPRGHPMDAQRGYPPSYFNNPEGQQQQQQRPTREQVLEIVKGQLQGRYNRGLLSKAAFVAIAKSALAEVLQLAEVDPSFLGGGWHERCAGVVAQQLRKHCPEAARPASPAARPHASPLRTASPKRARSSSVASSAASSVHSSSTRMRNQRRSSSPATYSALAGLTARTAMNTSAAGHATGGTSTATAEDAQLRGRRLRELRRRQQEHTAHRNGKQPLPSSVHILRDISNTGPAARGKAAEEQSPPAPPSSDGVGADARRMMAQGLGRLEELSNRILRAQSPQEAEIFLHELRSYHFYALVAAGAPAGSDAACAKEKAIANSITSFEALSRSDIESCQSGAFDLLQQAAAESARAATLLEEGRAARESAESAAAEAAAAAAAAAEATAPCSPDADPTPTETSSSDGSQDDDLGVWLGGWQRYTAANGLDYYHNPETGVTSWVPPAVGALGESTGAPVVQAVSGGGAAAVHRGGGKAARGGAKAGAVAGGGGASAVASALPPPPYPPKEEVVEYIRSLLQPLYNSGAMGQKLFLDVIRKVTKNLFAQQWASGSTEWKVFVCKSIESLVS